jgi:hypothetical protein
MPCIFPKAKEALTSIIEDDVYDFALLPATTVEGKPVLPVKYGQRLQGATVLAHIRLSTKFSVTEGHYFYADIESLSILSPPIPIISRPISKSPSKKRRFQLPDYVEKARSKKKT